MFVLIDLSDIEIGNQNISISPVEVNWELIDVEVEDEEFDDFFISEFDQSEELA